MTIRRPDATIARRHLIDVISYRTEKIDCTCGETIQAEPDAERHDAHAPLIAMWEQHKRASGVIPRGSDKRRLGKP